MHIKKKLEELEKKKVTIERQVGSIQQQLSNLNRGYLIILGKIQAYQEMLKEEKSKSVEDGTSKAE